MESVKTSTRSPPEMLSGKARNVVRMDRTSSGRWIVSSPTAGLPAASMV
jgi:hypothetical protein